MNKLLVICGPTATGKTSMAVQIAKKLNGELISADSRQVYIGMDIGTGKDREKLDGIPIWMYDVVRPDEEFSVSHYQSLASQALTDIWSRGKLPIIVGGTGFYINSLINPPESIHIPRDETLRHTLISYSVVELQDRLCKLDPRVYQSLNNSDKSNPRRLIRKIEIAERQDDRKPRVLNVPLYTCYQVGLITSIVELQKRIAIRVDVRVEQGIISEITKLLALGYTWDLPSMSGMGYMQWKPYFEAKNKEEFKKTIIEEWKHAEYLYAKKQCTWFKKRNDITWFDVTRPGYPDNVTKSVLAWYTEENHEHKN